MTTETKQLELQSNPAPDDLKGYIEVMVRYHHCKGKTLYEAAYKRAAKGAKKRSESMKEEVEARVSERCAWECGAIASLLEVYDHMGYGAATLPTDLFTMPECCLCPNHAVI